MPCNRGSLRLGIVGQLHSMIVPPNYSLKLPTDEGRCSRLVCCSHHHVLVRITHPHRSHGCPHLLDHTYLGPPKEECLHPVLLDPATLRPGDRMDQCLLHPDKGAP